jgi:hypothetical protein
MVNVWDFAKLAQRKLDPVAWDYLAEGSEDELALRDNRLAFNRIILRPHWLTQVQKIEVSTTLFGKTHSSSRLPGSVGLHQPVGVDLLSTASDFVPKPRSQESRASRSLGNRLAHGDRTEGLYISA